MLLLLELGKVELDETKLELLLLELDEQEIKLELLLLELDEEELHETRLQLLLELDDDEELELLEDCRIEKLKEVCSTPVIGFRSLKDV